MYQNSPLVRRAAPETAPKEEPLYLTILQSGQDPKEEPLYDRILQSGQDKEEQLYANVDTTDLP